MKTGTVRITARTDREIEISRMFDAPRQLVFDAHTKPELVKRWLGVHRGWSLAVCEIDLRVGGAYRYVWRGPDGADMGMRGVFLEIVAPERLVSTEVFDQSWYPGEAVDTLTLVEQGGRTTLTLNVRYESREARDAVLKSPMEEGMAAGYDKLAELLASTKS
ncbi:MAG: SRPBCC family protein [Gemmatimonadales bacterium]